mgnify:CR=1 FL=1
MTKKGQAALEFLTTYAWAFLVILIMVGALAYFGILRPTKLLPDRCNFGTEINCVDFALRYGTTGLDGSINLRLKNSFGEAVYVNSINITSDTSTLLTCTLSTPSIASPGFLWNTDATQDFAFITCNTAASGFVQGEKSRFDIRLTYYSAKTSATYAKQVSGEIFATVV